jgi:hypothetical protein
MLREMPELLKWKVGYAADPAIDILLDKAKIAQIKVKELDARIHELETSLEVIRMTRDALVEQYKIK